MTELSAFPILRKWPPQHPDGIQFYALMTPNGVKASAMLAESGLAYEAYCVDFGTDDQLSPEFLSLNPNNKIPAIIDPDGPVGVPPPLWGAGAVLLYLAEKSGRLPPSDPAQRYETIQWLMLQMGGAGPMFGRFGYCQRWAGREIENKRPLQRSATESKRLPSVIDKRLSGRPISWARSIRSRMRRFGPGRRRSTRAMTEARSSASIGMPKSGRGLRRVSPGWPAEPRSRSRRSPPEDLSVQRNRRDEF